MYEFFIYFGIGLILCFLLDILSQYIYRKFSIVEYSQNVRWFFIHFIINCIVSYYGFSDLLFCLQNFGLCGTTSWISGSIAYGLAVSLHIYHIIAFKLTAIDWLHHTLTALISTPIMLLYCQYSSAVMALWFMSGFPGAIDYFLLWLVKMGYLAADIEKKVYIALSVWLRAPGCIIASLLGSTALFMLPGISWLNFFGLLWAVLIVFWNGLFFMHITLASYYTNAGKQKQIRYTKLKEDFT